MFNFANPSAARRWDVARTKEKPTNPEPQDAVSRATAAVTDAVDFVRRTVVAEPPPAAKAAGPSKTSRSEAEEPVGGGSEDVDAPLSLSRRSVAT
eukprot:5231937-Prymnesium_polylepis.1